MVTIHCIDISWADPGFQVRGGGAQLKKLRRADRGAKIFGVFRVKNHDFTPKNHIFTPWIRPCICTFFVCKSTNLIVATKNKDY